MNSSTTPAPTTKHFSVTIHQEAEDQLETLIICSLSAFALSFVLFCVRKAVQNVPRLVRTSQAVDVAAWSVLYISFSVSMVVYNKWLLNSWQGGFRFPLFVSMCHMMLKMVFSTIVVRAWYDKKDMVKIPNSVYYWSAVPVGIATALDIAASNLSFIYISIPFYTVVKSSSVLFVLFFSIWYKLQPCDYKLILVSFIIAGGVAMSVYGDSAKFSPFGFSLVIAASAIGGFRWAKTQLLMEELGSKLNGLITVYTISPAASLTLIPFCLYLEGGRIIKSKFFIEFDFVIYTFLNIVATAFFAFGMILVELALIERTSSLTLTIISYLKQFLQIFLAIAVFGTTVTPLNVLGMTITVVGLSMYSYVKTRSLPSQLINDEDAEEMILKETPSGSTNGYASVALEPNVEESELVNS